MHIHRVYRRWGVEAAKELRTKEICIVDPEGQIEM
jgi:hypothetical protein